MTEFNVQYRDVPVPKSVLIPSAFLGGERVLDAFKAGVDGAIETLKAEDDKTVDSLNLKIKSTVVEGTAYDYPECDSYADSPAVWVLLPDGRVVFRRPEGSYTSESVYNSIDEIRRVKLVNLGPTTVDLALLEDDD